MVSRMGGRASWLCAISMLVSSCALLYCIGIAEALDCYQCTDVGNVSDCHTVDVCPVNQLCHTNSTGTGNIVQFNLGCKPQEDCSVGHHPPLSLVGRAATSVSAASTADCSQCCGVDVCNKHLCATGVPVTTIGIGACKDDPDYNCQLISGTFNICGDIHHAKLRCRKFCGLCNLVDGVWAPWNSWTECDVTCGVGTQTRSRACTAPAPAHGGLDCAGSGVEHRNCTLDQCPVHGGWSRWTAWGSCSVTCGVGMGHRDRGCTNPRPGQMGDQCFGVSREYRICLSGACHDGGWSLWSHWTVCSATCGAGMETRNRACNNPPPSQFGKMCLGSTDQMAICNKRNCPTVVSAFTVTNAARVSSSRTIKFTHVVYNEGGDYNTSTGNFACEHPGLYTFNLNLLMIPGSSEAYCYLYKNNVPLARAYTDHGTPHGHYETSVSATIHLVTGDTVYPGGCTVNSTIFSGVDLDSFTGFLVSAD